MRSSASIVLLAVGGLFCAACQGQEPAPAKLRPRPPAPITTRADISNEPPLYLAQRRPMWPQQLASRCSGGAPARRGPAVCFGPTDQRSYAKGQAISAKLSWRGAPKDASIVVYLEHDAPVEEPYLGPVGPLTWAFAADGAGSRAYSWNGREFLCDPTDFATTCPSTAEVGRYRLRAVLYDRSVVPVGMIANREEEVLSHAVSPAFSVTGEPDLRRIAPEMRTAAEEHARKASDDFALASNHRRIGFTVRDVGDGRYCAAIPGSAPYESTLEACVPKARVLGPEGLRRIAPTDVDVSGRVAVAAGAISRETARALAQEAADRRYRFRVMFGRQRSGAHPSGPYLSHAYGETFYRADLGGAWAVVVPEIMGGGEFLPAKLRFSERVLVLVRPDRAACVIETVPISPSKDRFTQDPETAPLRCS